MGKSMIIWIIIGVALILVGGLFIAGTISSIQWDFSKLSTNKTESNTYEIKEKFSDISINTESADITFVPSEDKTCKVICSEEINAKHNVKVENDTLLIKIENKKEWYENIGIHFDNLSITVYLPKNEYDLLTIKAITSDIDISESFKYHNVEMKLTTGDVICNASAKDSITINLSTGDVKLTNVKCNNFKSKGTTGDIYLSNVVAKSKLSVQRTTGDVEFDKCDAQDIFVKTTTGDVKGSLLSSKVFITDVTTGTVNVPKLMSGGMCEIDVTTGDVDINVVE